MTLRRIGRRISDFRAVAALLLAISALLFAGPAMAEVPAVLTVGPIQHCASGNPLLECRPVDLYQLRMAGPETMLVRTVTVRPDALPLSQPLMVRIVAVASSEVRWNGIVIGRNGVPGPDRLRERPGVFRATFVVPGAAVRPGANIVSARLSANHAWFPLRRPLRTFAVAPYESESLPRLIHYLPTIMALGALAAAFIYFSVAVVLDQGQRSTRLLALISGSALLQGGAETIQGFIGYTYPWHLARLFAIALLATVTAVLIAVYAARRFASDWETPAMLLTAAAGLVSLLLLDGGDPETMGAIVCGMTALLICSSRGVRMRLPGARIAAISASLLLALLYWQGAVFLDQTYYIGLAALLVTLVGEQLLVLRHTRAGWRENRILNHQLGDQQATLQAINKKLFDQARIDPLTELSTRLKLTEDLDVLSACIAQDAETYCVVMFNIDYFKQYNETYGHLKGDETLRKVADSISNECVTGDRVYRYGGAEFLLILSARTIEEGQVRASYVGAKVEAMAIPHSASPSGRVTVSMGVALLAFDPGKSSLEWLNEVDAALYKVKHAGRVVIANDLGGDRGPNRASYALNYIGAHGQCASLTFGATPNGRRGL